MKTLAEMGEHEVIRVLTAALRNEADLVVGVGDDCAVARLPGGETDQVLTTDAVVEGVHFLPREVPERIGNKAAGRALSDIAAMGARPQWMLVNVVAPPELEFQVLQGVYHGMTACCERFGAAIVGGDVTRGAALELHLFATGTLPAGTALLRSGARAGDSIYVSGALGCSRAGRHLDFVPRVEEGVFLRESGAVGALMDISDGLATDLRHIMKQSGVGAELFADRIPCAGTLEQALYDGEDYELLFTLRNADQAPFLDEWERRTGEAAICIGRVTDEAGVLRLCASDGSSRPLDHKAYEHFQSESGPR